MSTETKEAVGIWFAVIILSAAIVAGWIVK